MKNIMIDLETMGTNSFSPIISIGAVYFDETGIGERFYEKVSLDSCLKSGMKVDAHTVMWWLKQSDEARKEFEGNEYHSDIRNVLIMFSVFCKEFSLVWGNDFDIVILGNAYKCFVDLPIPWQFYNVRCFRTLKSLFPDINIKTTGLTEHNALCDAVWQANCAVECLKKLRGL